MHILRDNKDVKAMHATDESAFQWSRYVHNQWRKTEIVGPGIVKAWIAILAPKAQPSLVLRRCDNAYCAIKPSDTKGNPLTDAEITPAMLLMLDSAPIATTPWLRIA